MRSLGLPELVVILVIILLLFGANKIPQLMRGMGQGLKEFKKGMKDDDDEKKGGAAPEAVKGTMEKGGGNGKPA